MDKIYSRPRLPRLRINLNRGGNSYNINYKIKPHKKIIIVLITILIIGYFTAITIIKAITPIIERQCRVIAQSTASKFANEACNEAMQNITYEDLCTIERGSEGRIRLIEMNVVNVNKLNSQIALNIQEKLNDTTSSKFYIRLGSFTGSKLLSGRGPNVEVRMSTIGAVTTDIKSEFTETGINQTMHKIYIDINCNVSLLSPFKDLDEQITAQVLLSETVISGDIPDSYYDLEGMSPEDTMNMMN